MGSFHRTAIALAGALLAWSAARAVRADEPHEPVILSYRAPAACPKESEFLAEVRQRTTRLREPRPGEPSRRFSVAITLSKPARGRLEIRDSDGGRSRRVVEGDNCSEVASALALMVAIAVDPTVTMKPLAAPEQAPAPAPVMSEPPAPAKVPPPVMPARPRKPPPPPKRRVFTAALAAEGALAAGVAPGVLWGAGLTATWTAPLAPEPSVRFAVTYLTGASTNVEDAGAGFSRLAITLDGCAVRARFGPVSLFPCARLTAGALRAEGEHIARATREVRPWVAVGPSPRARWNVHRGLFVELGAAVMIPLKRDRFFFQPDATIYRAAPVGLEADFSIGAEL
ncbi:hypothetical protein [Pendulispora albinea]|uniref:Uncharacterized protein n=1 Tax=Pendulispora albinea TaxID=2741071 RepID=A0ABZ2MBE3_9BACT